MLKDYLEMYLEILKRPISGYDEKDKVLYGSIDPIDIEKNCFEPLDSDIPKFVDNIVNFVKTNGFQENKIKMIIEEFYQKKHFKVTKGKANKFNNFVIS